MFVKLYQIFQSCDFMGISIRYTNNHGVLKTYNYQLV